MNEQGPYYSKGKNGRYYAGFSDRPIGSPWSSHIQSAYQDAAFHEFLDGEKEMRERIRKSIDEKINNPFGL